jgi:tRNA(Arg) A34 adenosine deaminase TadA
MPALDHQAYMKLAIDQMRRSGLIEKSGGPFGAVVVREGRVLAVAGNSTLRDRDPTAHAEINAIRMACRHLDTHDLTGCVLYSTCECCPMCYSAAYWARIAKIYFAVPWQVYSDLFDDLAINQDLSLPDGQRLLAPEHLPDSDALAVWEEFRALSDGARY